MSTAAADCATRGLRGAGADAAACLREVDERPHRVLLLLTDGLAGDQQEIVRGAYGVVGAGVPLVGGCAGDDLKMKATFQLHGDSRAATARWSAAAIASDAPLGVGVRHGWRRVGEPMLVTESADNRVYTLDDRPALDVYLDRLDRPAGGSPDPAEFTRFALTHPLGLGRRSGEDHVRFVGEADFERALARLHRRGAPGRHGLVHGGRRRVGARGHRRRLRGRARAARRPDARSGCSPSTASPGAECSATRESGRRWTRGGATPADAPVAGFYTYGEIARTHGVSGFHNQTLVVLALA